MLSALAPHVSAGVGIDTDKDMLSIARHRLAVEDLSHISVRRGDMYELDLNSQTLIWSVFMGFALCGAARACVKGGGQRPSALRAS